MVSSGIEELNELYANANKQGISFVHCQVIML